jgi:perosamine synthetase
MVKKYIQTAGPWITEKEIRYVNDAVTNGWYENWNHYIKLFESSFAKYIGTSFSLATSSCTGALHLIFKGLNIGPGDEVIIPETTWVATAAAVTYVGAKPVFVDVDPQSYTIDPEKISEKISDNTRVIVPVHLYGHPAEMGPILEIAEDKKIFVVEDAAPSIGAEYKGKKTGSFGDAAAFSFQGAKLLVTGEGGMVVSNNSDLFKHISSIADQGRNPDKTFWIDEIGLKYKMSNMQAALGLAQLERIDELIAKKRLIHEWYSQYLKGCNLVSLSQEKNWAKGIHWMPSLIFDRAVPLCRDEIQARLEEKNIGTRPIFPPLSHFSMFKKQHSPVAEFIYERGINLPSAMNLEEEDIKYVCEAISSIIE